MNEQAMNNKEMTHLLFVNQETAIERIVILFLI